MKLKWLAGFLCLHFLLSLAAFVGLYGSAAALQDAGVGIAPLGWLELPLRYVLLQPFAHWVLLMLPIAWWTWPGLAALIVLIGVNSLAVAGVLGACLGVGFTWRRRV